MQTIFAPWRAQYIVAEKQAGCVFCDILTTIDSATVPDARRERLVLYLGRHVAVLMNRYPYINGHIMAVPRRHCARLADLGASERSELMDGVVLGESVLEHEMHCDGINIGLNLGAAAGAGVAEHLHVHIVPRWAGDANFMSTVGKVRVISQALDETFDVLRPAFAAHEQGQAAQPFS